MRTNRQLLLLALASLMIPAMPIAAAETEFEARFWMPELDGLLQVSEGTLGTELDLANDIGIDQDEATEVRLQWQTDGAFRVRFGYVPLAYAGASSLQESIEFGGVTFPVSFDLASTIDMDYGRAGLGWLFAVNDDLRIGPILEVKALRAEAALQGSVLGIPLAAATDTEEAAFGSIGGAFDARPIPTLHIVGEAGYSPGLDYGEMVEAELGVKFAPTKVVSVFGGYRMINIDVEDDDDRLDFDMSGPYLGASVNF